MSLTEQINKAIIEAMKAKAEAKLRALRAIKSAIILAQTAEGASKELDEAQENAIIQKLLKQRKDSLAIYQEQNRQDLAQQELEEIEVIEKYMPEMMSEEAVAAAIDKIIANTGANGPADMGKVMGPAMKELGGKADGKLVSQLVRQKLAGN